MEKAQIVFTSGEQRDAFQFPFGKTLGGRVVSSYFFGALEYPIYMNEKVRQIPAKDIYAEAFVTGTEQKVPAIVLTDYGKGKVLYVNLPLGQLKAIGDDLPLRAALRTFLFDAVGVPRLMNVEGGKGTLLVNWHVDSRAEIYNIPQLLDTPIFAKELNATYHITAGDFLNREGDDAGFYVRERGRDLTEIMAELGEVGSHGGWAHNWFASRLLSGAFSKDDVIKYIKDNSDDIEAVTGQKVTSYSAPNGVYPQPLLTNIIKDMGMIAYYYTGDTGSSPHRVFWGNEMVSSRVIAFPIMPFGKAASLWEMYDRYDFPFAEIEYFYRNLLDYVEKTKSARLIYSHPVDITEEYIPLMSDFAQAAIDRAAEGKIKLSGDQALVAQLKSIWPD
jgi:peptidoglycan/xylan/chitin deacetylase (PgdA/CDA1 family)